ncbi:E3 ubiquitin-protein ligase RNF213 [Platysternon megacephalum]|uniref:E3 ubiquitin-protein ligase RNF213 n=1 Tax=Platysternon megacephalum TaxID=55544 RepID=A0A4D9EE99_9SAUR|nr:E3 ubiquitin-protein ligase RNF213 [Platysternon megacephalum]
METSILTTACWAFLWVALGEEMLDSLKSAAVLKAGCYSQVSPKSGEQLVRDNLSHTVGESGTNRHRRFSDVGAERLPGIADLALKGSTSMAQAPLLEQRTLCETKHLFFKDSMSCLPACLLVNCTRDLDLLEEVGSFEACCLCFSLLAVYCSPYRILNLHNVQSGTSE